MCNRSSAATSTAPMNCVVFRITSSFQIKIIYINLFSAAMLLLGKKDLKSKKRVADALLQRSVFICYPLVLRTPAGYTSCESQLKWL